MPSPRNRSVPRFAPEGSITLITALDIFGREVDPAWTGEEIEADTAPEPSDEHLANLAFARVTCEAADNPRGEVGIDNPSEQEILADLHNQRERQFGPRCRWRTAAIRFMGYLHQGMLRPFAIGTDGMVNEVPSHLWASEHAEDLFDNGGWLDIRNGQLAIPRRLIDTDTATVLVNEGEVQRLVTAINAGDIPSAATVATIEQAHPYRTGFPGKPSIRHLIEAQLRQRAAAGECETTVSGEARALEEWAKSTHPKGGRATAKSIENVIRDLYRMLVRGTK